MIVLVLPAYNEHPEIAALLERARDLQSTLCRDLRVIVVDDGSEDATADCVESVRGLPVKLIRHERNAGLSAALRTGLMEAIRTSCPKDVIVTMDADDTHPPALIKQMADRIDEGGDVVIASRFRPGSRVVGLSSFRKHLSLAARALFRLIFPIKGVRDYTCGYRAYRAELLQRGFQFWGDRFIDQPGFSCMADLLLKLSVFDPVIVEVPLILRYDRKCGISKMRIKRTLTETLSLMTRRRLSMGAMRKRAAKFVEQQKLEPSAGEERWPKAA